MHRVFILKRKVRRVRPMDLFQNVINQQKFRSTNGIWNKLKLNHPISVGYVTTLIESKTFATKEEWRDYYYESGKQRLLIAKEKGLNLDNPQRYEEKHLQHSFGRTENELKEKGKFLYQALQLQGNPLNITLAECVYMVKYRVIGETWNGVIAREKNTIATLQKYFPQLTFQKVSGENDFQYAIDYEVYHDMNLLFAIQIKPISYAKGTSHAILSAKKANEQKNADYFRRFNKQVLYIYSNNKGELLNLDILSSIKERLYSLQIA